MQRTHATRDPGHVIIAVAMDAKPAIKDMLEPGLPPAFAAWFSARGWQPRRHQLELLELARAGTSALLIAPTGGKTLAGFLPSLIEIAELKKTQRRKRSSIGLHTLYASPLKALAVDVARNLDAPISQIGLDVSVEVRTGDTPAARRQRQLHALPDILITTPEQVALLLAGKGADRLFADLKRHYRR